MLGVLTLAGLGYALMGNPRRKRKVRRNPTGRYWLVEKRNRDVLHGIFDSESSARRFLSETVPEYIARGYYMNKSLKPQDFTVIPEPERPPRKKRGSTRRNPRKAVKTKLVYVIQGNYGYGWDDENEEDNKVDAKRSLKEYRDNGPGSYRLIRRREKLEGNPRKRKPKAKKRRSKAKGWARTTTVTRVTKMTRKNPHRRKARRK